jgi:hypothetical protein
VHKNTIEAAEPQFCKNLLLSVFADILYLIMAVAEPSDQVRKQ